MTDMDLDDISFVEGLAELGLKSEGDGRWTSGPDLAKEIVDFGSGITITSRIYPDAPEFDITTVFQGTERTGGFLHEAILNHIDEIDRRTRIIIEQGVAAIRKPSSSS